MALPLPPLLVEMMEDGRWTHPGVEGIAKIAPFIRDELEFRISPNLVREGECIMLDTEVENEFLHEYRGSKIGTERELPWIDVEKTALIAINRFPGDDVSIALDYRTSITDPRVVGTEWVEGNGNGLYWREIAPTFTIFADMFGRLKKNQPLDDSTSSI